MAFTKSEKKNTSKLRKYRRSIIFLNKLILVALFVASFAFCFFNYYEQAVFFYKGNFILSFLYIVIFVVLASTYGCFRIGFLSRGELVFSLSLSIVITNIIVYFMISLIARAMLDPIALLALSVIQILTGAAFYGYANKMYFWLYPARDCVAIGGTKEQDLAIFHKFHQIKMRYNICLVLSERDDFDKLIKSIDQYSAVILGNINMELRTKLIAYCFENNKRLYVEPTISDILFNNAHESQVNDSLVYLCRNSGPAIEQLIIKRMIDIVASVLGIIAFSPAMLIIAIAIKLYDRGPVLFKQKRLTLNGREFMLIKFRSMIVNAEKDGKARLSYKHDERITPIGKIIRATRLDELPQMINILKGDMSLVGPRPERAEIMEEYKDIFPAFHYRLKMKAGLTGYAQIYGKYNTTFEDKVKMDLIYILRYSVLNDIRLIFSTIKIVFMKKSTEGVSPSIVSMAENENHTSTKDIEL